MVTFRAPADAYSGAHRSGSAIIRWQSSGSAACFSKAATTGRPIVRFGTKWPSMTSICSQSATSATAAASSASLAKSAASTLGAIWTVMTPAVYEDRIDRGTEAGGQRGHADRAAERVSYPSARFARVFEHRSKEGM